jgi:phosphatidylserine/phosphatidylglycerophosphate/cardiolipin synthase-like enzyme
MRSPLTRLLLLLALAGTALAGPGAAAAGTAAAEPDPVINHAVFNDPLGTPAEQNAIFIQLARLIDRVPAGEEIQLSWFGFDPPDTADSADDPDLTDRLVAAYNRGVRVKIILNHTEVGKAPQARLAALLGTDDTKPSYIVSCKDQFPSGADRGCIATRQTSWAIGYNHNKFLTATKVALSTGTVSNVVFQSSSNLGRWDTIEVYQNAVTFSEAPTFAAYRTYFEDLRRYRHDADGNNSYYWSSPTGTDYRAYFFPRPERSGQPYDDPPSDTIYNILDTVTSCTYDDNGTRRQTDIRVVQWAFNRPALAAKLTELRRAGCWVDVVFSGANAEVLAELQVSGGPQLTKCNFNVAPEIDIRAHSKYLLIDGAYDNDIVPRVFTGSHNWSRDSLRVSDEAMVRIMGRGIHDEYLRNFWHVRDTCRANGGIVT